MRGAAVMIAAVIALVGQCSTDFLGARPFVHDVMDADALYEAGALDASWDDLFHCWCGCPL